MWIVNVDVIKSLVYMHCIIDLFEGRNFGLTHNNQKFESVSFNSYFNDHIRSVSVERRFSPLIQDSIALKWVNKTNQCNISSRDSTFFRTKILVLFGNNIAKSFNSSWHSNHIRDASIGSGRKRTFNQTNLSQCHYKSGTMCNAQAQRPRIVY